MYISGRERKVLEMLLDKQGNITVKQLAKKLEVSARTLHRDLKNIEEILSGYNLTLVKKSGVGVQISGDAMQKQALEMVLFNVSFTDYTPEERQAIILSTLLEKNEPIKLFALAEELNVTVATVSHDLDKIEEELKKYNLTLIRRRGYGVEVSGKEEHKRSVLSGLILKHIDEFDFVSLLRENIEKKSKKQFDTISNRLLGLVDQEKIYTIEKSVERAQKFLPYELADSAYIGLVVHLALAIERLQKGDNIQFDEVYLKQIEDTLEYQIAGDILKELEEMLNMSIPVDEIGYITMHLMGAKLRGDQVYLLEESNLDIMEKINYLIRFVSDEINQDLTGNTRLLNDLAAHLKPTIYRLNQRMRIKNPLLEEIRQDYRNLFDILEEGVQIVFPEIVFPEEEIGYLVLHFASVILAVNEKDGWRALVICSSGIGTAKMLSSRLLQEFPEVKEVENSSLFDLESIEAGEFDLIVSTIPIKGMANRYIQVSPILTDNEIKQIEKVIRRLRINRRTEQIPEEAKNNDNRTVVSVMPRLQKMQKYSAAVISVLTNFFLEEIQGSIGLSAALKHACQILEEKGIINDKESVLNKIYAREDIGGLGIPGTELALYHTRAVEVDVPVFTILSLSAPVNLKGMDGHKMSVSRLLLMLTPENPGEEALEVMGTISALLIRDKQTTALFETGSAQEINQFLTIQLDLLVNEKIQ